MLAMTAPSPARNNRIVRHSRIRATALAILAAGMFALAGCDKGEGEAQAADGEGEKKQADAVPV